MIVPKLPSFFTLSFCSPKPPGPFSPRESPIASISLRHPEHRVDTFERRKRFRARTRRKGSPRNPSRGVRDREKVRHIVAYIVPYARSRVRAATRPRYLRSVCVAVPCVGRSRRRRRRRGQQGDTVCAAAWSLYVMGTCHAGGTRQRSCARVFPPFCARKSARFHVRSNLRSAFRRGRDDGENAIPPRKRRCKTVLYSSAAISTFGTVASLYSRFSSYSHTRCIFTVMRSLYSCLVLFSIIFFLFF